MTANRLLLLGALCWLAISLMTVVTLFAVAPAPHSQPLPTSGVPGCTAHSARTVTIPAGVTTAFSCPTHIQVVSYDQTIPTRITFSQARPDH